MKPGDLCRQRGISSAQLAELTGLEPARLDAILQGRWTPSPAERERLAGALGVAPEQIAWGHAAPVERLYGHGPT